MQLAEPTLAGRIHRIEAGFVEPWLGVRPDLERLHVHFRTIPRIGLEIRKFEKSKRGGFGMNAQLDLWYASKNPPTKPKTPAIRSGTLSFVFEVSARSNNA